MRSVLILTAGYGEGHNAAARGLKEGFDLLGEVRAEVLDLFAPAFGKFYQRSRKDYLKIVNNSPNLWASIYSALDRFPLTHRAFQMLWPLRKALTTTLAEVKPSAIISVFPVYNHLVAQCAKDAGLQELRNFTLITDSITVNSAWFRCAADAFLVPNEDTANVLRDRGVSPERLFVSGFPVSTKYAAQGEARPDPGEGTIPRVLYMINGDPGRAIPLVERLLRECEIELTVTAGRDEGLARALEELGEHAPRPLSVMGWVSHMPQLLRRNHLLIGKAGGATVQEALAAQAPMLMTQILPGQEEGNARLLLQNGCGAHCPTNEAVVSVLSQLFSQGAHGWHQMHRHVTALSRPDAAITTARWVAQRLRQAGPRAEPPFGVRPGKS